MLRSSDFLVGGYIPRVSAIHRLDPRIKLVSFLLFMIAVFVSWDLTSMIPSACATLIVGFTSQLGRRTWFSAFYKFSWLLILAMVLNLLFYRHGVQSTVFGFMVPFSLESLQTALILVAQLSMGIALSVVLTATTMPTELIRGLGGLARPMSKIGVPVDEASTITYMALRFVPILQEEIRTIVEAQKSRGIDFSTRGILRRARALTSVLAPAIQGTLRRGDKLAIAMEARGYHPGSPRSAFPPPHMTIGDALALLFSAALAFFTISLEII